jgi:four helix bundle protein
MTNTASATGDRPKYDLKERTARLGERVIQLAGKLPQTPVNKPLVSQIVRAGTSVGANYMEADGTDSTPDFRYKIALCRKEAKETMHWLRMLAIANPQTAEGCRELWREAHELSLIFSTIAARCGKRA